MGEPCPRCGADRELILADQYSAWRCPACAEETAFLTPEQADHVREILATESQRN